MPTRLEEEFHLAMEDIYRRAREEIGYNARVFLRMVIEHGGREAARKLINARTVSDGYTALWERGRLDLTVEAKVIETPRFHGLFTSDELEICRRRLSECGYTVDVPVVVGDLHRRKEQTTRKRVLVALLALALALAAKVLYDYWME